MNIAVRFANDGLLVKVPFLVKLAALVNAAALVKVADGPAKA